MQNDVWSLGVILVNLTCGRNPWKQACPTDETFRAYLQNPDFLRSILPISTPCNELLKRIFALNPLARISLAELKAEVISMSTFTMTVDELRTATRATREAARAWQEVPSPSPAQGRPVEWEEAKRKKERKAEAAAKKAAAKQAARDEEGRRAAVRLAQEAAEAIQWEHAGTVEVDADHTPNLRYVTPPSTPRRPQHPADVVRHSPLCDGGAGPLATAFSSASLSDDDAPPPLPPKNIARGHAPSPMHFVDANGVARNAQQVFPPTPSTPTHPHQGARKHQSRVSGSTRSPRIAQGTPTHRRRKESDDSGSSASSSSGASWTGLPATPQTPCFGRVQAEIVSPSAGRGVRDEVIDRVSSSGASYKAAYPIYAEWADHASLGGVAGTAAKRSLADDGDSTFHRLTQPRFVA